MKTLVIGATGLVGLEVCRRLREAGATVRALIRTTADAQKRAELERLGIELAEGDLKDPASLARACAGVQSVISTASSTLARQSGDSIETVDRRGQLALVDAARTAGVEHFVFVSFRDEPRHSLPADRGQARGRGGVEEVRNGLHHPAGLVLHGSVAHAGPRIRCGER